MGHENKSERTASPVLTRREAIDVLRSALISLPVTAAAICGSFARDEQSPTSDIDLLVSFKGGSGIDDVEMTRDVLEHATGRNIDLITTLDGQTKHFCDSVARDGLKIYG